MNNSHYNKDEKVLIVGINSQFIHSSLSIHCIFANSACSGLEIYECNINMTVDKIVSDILEFEPSIVAFSTYIFNINVIKKVSSALKAYGILIVFGGIEIENNLNAHIESCDFVLLGDGEVVFDEFLLGNRSQKIVCSSKKADMHTLCSPYTPKYFEMTRGKIAYFEASRGCPFHCSYCMSANTALTLFSLDRVFEDLIKFQGKDVKVLKFVDRTFNANADYSNSIVKFLIENQAKYAFQIHFEIAPELINDELVSILKKAKPNFIRMEIGMQSLNCDTLKKINRPFDSVKLQNQIKKLCSLANIDCHVDIIAGLPFEGFASLSSTFDRLFELAPTEIQLGMLKMLPRSPLSIEKIDGYFFDFAPPYQITKSAWLTESEIKELLKTEQVINRLHNSLRFRLTLNYVLKYFAKIDHILSSPFSLFHSFALFCDNLFCLSLFELYDCFLEFLCNNGLDRAVLIDLMRFDYACVNNSRALPKSLYVKYPKKYVVRFDKSKKYLLPLFHDIFSNYRECEMLLLFDYSDYDFLNRQFVFETIY